MRDRRRAEPRLQSGMAGPGQVGADGNAISDLLRRHPPNLWDASATEVQATGLL